MKKKTSKYTLRLLILASSWLLCLASGWSQQVHKAVPAQKKAEEKKAAEEHVPLYQGLSLEWEIAGLGSYLLGSDILNSEIALRANLKKSDTERRTPSTTETICTTRLQHPISALEPTTTYSIRKRISPDTSMPDSATA